MLPQDPAILLSFVNTRLRDGCPSLEEFCGEFDVDVTQITEKLSQIGYEYNPQENRFM